MSTMVIPRLALDFTSAVLDPRITFARSGATATRYNSAGFIESVAADSPRFDFSPVSLACKGLLVEGASTNLFTYSNDFRNTAQAGSTRPWTQLNMTLIENAVDSPDGTQNASKIVDNATNDLHSLGYIFSTTAAAYSMSIYAKLAGRNFLWMRLPNSAGAFRYAWFNLATGAKATVYSGVTANIEPAANGFYRCTISIDVAFNGAQTLRVGCSPSDNVFNYAGNGTDGIYVYGAQMEQAGGSTSLIPTAGSTSLRNADDALITGTNFSDFWQASRGGVLVRALPSTVSGTRPLAQFDDNTADNIIALRGNTTNPELYIKAGGVDQATIDAGTIAANTAYRLAGTWATNDVAANLNGAAAVLDTSATIPAVTQMRLGSDGTNYLNGHLQAVEYFDNRVPTAELQVVSSQAGSRSLIHSILQPVL